jgi:hypothetical protein
LFKTDELQMMLFRTLLSRHTPAQVQGRSDDAVIDAIADLLISGALHIHALTLEAVGLPATGASQRSSAFPVSDRRQRQASGARQEPSDPPTFAGVDSAAQASALAGAAEQGTPFCEVCARKAAGQAA